MDVITRTFKQLGHPDRLRILAALQQGELTVSELTRVLDLSQPRVTQYIGSLEAAGMIERLREGSWVFVRLTGGTGAVSDIVRAALSGLPSDDATLAADRDRLADVRRDRALEAERFFADVANNQGQLSHDFLPSSTIEDALLAAAGNGHFERMVDLGTGSGRMLQLFGGRVGRGVGIDLSPDMLRVARHQLAGENGPHLHVELGDIAATRLPADSADLVTLHHVLHYLDQPLTALQEAARLLRPGGRLIIADFAPHDFDAFRDRFAHRRLGFTPQEMDELLQRGNLSVGNVTRVATAEGPDVLIWQADKPRTRRSAA